MAFRVPIDEGQYKITQGFGGNADYYAQFGQAGHNGLDMGANTGTPVHAADDGTVVFEGWGQNHPWMLSPAGICIIINHGGSYAGYAHLNETVVNKGDQVSKGDIIGYVGATGAATGPHLHFEMLPLNPDFRNGYAGRIDPSPYIEAAVKNASDDEIRAAYRDILERYADDAGIEHYRNYPIDFVRNDLTNSQEKRDLEARKANEARAAAEKAQVAAEQKAEEAKREATRQKAAEAAAEAARQAEAAKAEQERIAAEEAAAKAASEAKAKQQAEIAAQADAQGVIVIDAETKANVAETLKVVKSIRGMLVNFIGYVKEKLGR